MRNPRETIWAAIWREKPLPRQEIKKPARRTSLFEIVAIESVAVKVWIYFLSCLISFQWYLHITQSENVMHIKIRIICPYK